MEKVNLNITLKNNEFEKKNNISGIFNTKNNILKYSDDSVDYTIDFNKSIMIRENNEFNMEIDFSKKVIGTMTLFYKQLSKRITFALIIEKLEISTNLFHLKYIINDTENVEYCIEIIK